MFSLHTILQFFYNNISFTDRDNFKDFSLPNYNYNTFFEFLNVPSCCCCTFIISKIMFLLLTFVISELQIAMHTLIWRVQINHRNIFSLVITLA